ncbi:CYTH and CHAD domain-containing protein [Pollutimonas bauzanensis]|uniref:CYTH domain-containing protein n=1 Tax=Pollutimonas bauzanensis TaxID=658167 RepID=A0A1M5ZL66_9BURK|nr:CYTH and CHAD domain-containing protein [Pollutimonas bauzanensis]SHI24683.1 CYTH domain-containing protein [Pollutimonas bauzanensis]
MLERELKFHVPADKRAALEKALRKLNAAVLPLHARYFDTEKHELAQARIALRLRKEGSQWVQTIKTPGPDELSRVEINTPRPDATLDLSVYQGSAIERALKKLECPLELRYETEVDRLVLKKKGRGGAIEFAYDQGVIKAGQLELPICELELELVSGGTDHLFAVARQWLARHGLILDLRSKAERGDALARDAVGARTGSLAPAARQAGDTPEPAQLRLPRRAGPIVLDPAHAAHEAYRLCANDCMNQIIRNATYLAGADSAGATAELRVEYVHQLRVGIRRIRSCWKFFGKWVEIDEAELGTELRRYFSLLGQARDRDVIALVVAPRLMRAGMPELALPGPDDHSTDATQALAASAGFQATLLTLLNHLVAVNETAQPRAGAAPPAAGKLGKALSKRLNKRLEDICRQGAQFGQLAIDAQHSLRKRVKGLRYSMEFAASMLSGKSYARLRDALADTQHTLGDLNDLYIAQDYYQGLAASQPQAWFAVGWLSAMQERKKAEAQAEFLRLAQAGRFKGKKA